MIHKRLLCFTSFFLFIVFLSACSPGTSIDSTHFDAKYYPPAANGEFNNLAIMFLGGSEGGFPKLYNYSDYTRSGIPCLALAYFDSANTQKRLDKIDLAYFKTAIDHFSGLPEVQDKKILIFGYSKGAELTLVLGSVFPEIRGVYALNPGDVIFQSPGSLANVEQSSSWVFNGNELPYIPLDSEIFKSVKGKNLRELYSTALETDWNENAAIKVEDINGPILIITGKEDIVWPSTEMGNRIITRLENKQFSFWSKHIVYENAGHTLNPFYSLGGTFFGNIKAGNDMKDQILLFLEEAAKQ